MNNLTPFGKFLRRMRIDASQTLKEMTVEITSKSGYSISSAFLSSIELGRKPINKELINSIIKTYSLNEEKIKQLNESAEQSVLSIKIIPNSENRELVTQFARQLNDLNPSQIESILKTLQNSQDKKD